MGLKERRAVQDYEKNDYPPLRDAIFKAMGFEVPMEVFWDKLALEDQSMHYKEGFTKVFFEPLRLSMESICRDDMGRDALKRSLKKIVITNLHDYGGETSFTFEKGTLTLDRHPTYEMDSIASRTEYLTDLLEKAL